MTRAARLVASATIALLVMMLAATWYIAHPTLWPEYRQAVAIIEGIERFKANHHGLPVDVVEATGKPITEAGPVFYQRSSDSRYIVWFGRSLGESYTYDSQAGTWH